MRVPFYNYNHILLIASQDRFSQEGKAQIKSFSIEANELTMYFSDYVRSQVHCNVTEELFKRDRELYIRLYRGDIKGLETVKKYFIEDAKNFLLCNEANIVLTLIFDYEQHTNLIDVSEVAEVKEKINHVLEGDESSEDMLIWLCHNCADLSDVKNKIDNYATAYYLEVKERNND